MLRTVTHLFFIAFVLSAIEGSSQTLGRECDPHTIYEACGSNERCILKGNNTVCTCQRRFMNIGGECVEISTTAAASVDPTNRHGSDDSSKSGKAVVAGFFIPTILIALGGLGFCCARRYRLLPCRQNLYGNVLVTREEDDDDDPPIV